MWSAISRIFNKTSDCKQNRERGNNNNSVQTEVESASKPNENCEDTMAKAREDKKPRPIRIASEDLYDTHIAKQRASIKWLLSKSYSHKVPDDLLDPFYRDHEGVEHLKPQIIHTLSNAELYCSALSFLYSDPNYLRLNHWGVIQAMARKGVYVGEPSDVQLTETVLIQNSPLRMSAHMVVIEALMSLFVKETITADRVVSAVRNFPSAPSTTPPTDQEEGLVLWVNAACAALHRHIVEEVGQLRNTEEEPFTPPQFRQHQDLSDLSDGIGLCALISLYCQDDLLWSDITQPRSPTSPLCMADSLYNLQMVLRFSQETLPFPVCHLTLEDLVYMHSSIKQNVLCFLADIFHIFEIQPVECVRSPGLLGERIITDLHQQINSKSGSSSGSYPKRSTQSDKDRRRGVVSEGSKSGTPVRQPEFPVHRGKAVPTLSQVLRPGSPVTDEPLMAAQLRPAKEKFNHDTKAEERGEERRGEVPAAGRPSNYGEGKTSSYSGRRSRRNSLSEECHITLENFGGSQENLHMLGRNPDKEPVVVVHSGKKDPEVLLLRKELSWDEKRDSEKDESLFNSPAKQQIVLIAEAAKSALESLQSGDSTAKATSFAELSKLKTTLSEPINTSGGINIVYMQHDREQDNHKIPRRPDKKSPFTLPSSATTTWQQQQQQSQQFEPQQQNNNDEHPELMATQLHSIRMKLEEKRRGIDSDKRRMEVAMNKQRQRMGKQAFLQAVTKEINDDLSSIKSKWLERDDGRRTPDVENMDYDQYQQSLARMDSSLHELQSDIQRIAAQQHQIQQVMGSSPTPPPPHQQDQFFLHHNGTTSMSATASPQRRVWGQPQQFVPHEYPTNTTPRRAQWGQPQPIRMIVDQPYQPAPYMEYPPYQNGGGDFFYNLQSQQQQQQFPDHPQHLQQQHMSINTPQHMSINTTPMQMPQQQHMSMQATPSPHQQQHMSMHTAPSPQQQQRMSMQPNPQQHMSMQPAPSPQQQHLMNIQTTPSPQQQHLMNIQTTPSPQQQLMNIQTTPSPPFRLHSAENTPKQASTPVSRRTVSAPTSHISPSPSSVHHAPLPAPPADDMEPQNVSFIDNSSTPPELPRRLNRLNISSGSRTYRVSSGDNASPPRPSIPRLFPSETNNTSPTNNIPQQQTAEQSEDEKNSFYISFEESPKRPKPPLRTRRSSPLKKQNSTPATNNNRTEVTTPDWESQPVHTRNHSERFQIDPSAPLEEMLPLNDIGLDEVDKQSSPALGIVIGSDLVNPDPSALEEMEKRKKRLMEESQRRKEESERTKGRKERELQQRRDEERMKNEDRDRRREEEKQRRANILEEYRRRKAKDEAERTGKDMPEPVSAKQVPKLRPKGSTTSRPRPKTIHVDSNNSSNDVSLSSSRRNLMGSNNNLAEYKTSGGLRRSEGRRGSSSSLVPLSRRGSNASLYSDAGDSSNKGTWSKGSSRGRSRSTVSLNEDPSLQFQSRTLQKGHTGRRESANNRGGSTSSNRRGSYYDSWESLQGDWQGSSNSLYDDWDSRGSRIRSPSVGSHVGRKGSLGGYVGNGPGSLPLGLISRRRGFDDGASDISSVASSNMDYSGPRLYKQPAAKSNRSLILNAVEYCVFPGVVNREAKQRVLEEIARSEAKHFLVLFRDAGCQFRALYAYYPDRSDEVVKLYGTGPKMVPENMYDKFFKYNSGSKCFSQIHTKHLTVTIDAFTIHNSIWMGKRVNLPNKKDMTLVI